MNLATIIRVILILYTMHTVTSAKSKGTSYRNPLRGERYPDSSYEHSDTKQRNSVCKPRVLKAIIAQTENTTETIQVALNNFDSSQQNVDNNIRKLDDSLRNTRNTIFTILLKLDEHAELIKGFNDTVNASVENCNKVYVKIDGILDEVSTAAEDSTRISEIVSSAQFDLQNALEQFSNETEASIEDLSTLINESVLNLLVNLEESAAKVEAGQQSIKAEVKLLRELRTLSENIVVNVKAIQGQITSLNETEEARLNELKEQIQLLIIKNDQCLRGRPYHTLLAELKSIATKLVPCINSGNLVKSGLTDVQADYKGLLNQVQDLQRFTLKRANEILQNQDCLKRALRHHPHANYPYDNIELCSIVTIS